MARRTRGSGRGMAGRDDAPDDPSGLLTAMAALDDVEDTPGVEAERAALRARAEAVGVRLMSFMITEEPIPDPAIERLSKRERDRIERVTHGMFQDPASQVGELEELVARHPGLPMLRNHLAGALQAAGEIERAGAMIEETAGRFPDYLFGFANWVMWLVQEGRSDEARALLEPEGGPGRMGFAAFDPGREVFHLTEVVCYTATVGHYLLTTGRRREAERQLAMCREIAPGHPQTLALEKRIEHARVLEVVRGAAAKLLEGRGKKAKGRGKKKG